jgi:hypothetical protein
LAQFARISANLTGLWEVLFLLAMPFYPEVQKLAQA